MHIVNSKPGTTVSRYKTAIPAAALLTAALLVTALISLASCGRPADPAVPDTRSGPAAAEDRYGPIADRVIFEVRMDQTLALKDVVEGKADVFFQAAPPAILRSLNQEDLDKLDIYAVPSGSWSLLLNPIPNKPPYTWTTRTGVTTFNPLAVREIRYALNRLINRKKMIDEILLGDGEPTYTPMTPGQPGTYRYNLIPARLGLTPAGDERGAIAEITAAMNAAAALPENRGKLLRGSGGFWKYGGRDIVLKFLIRVDDPNGRLPAGRYIADQIEKAGFRVERLERDRSAISIAYYSDPAELQFHLYTEGWSAGATRAWWDVTVSQMYAPYYGYMPGGAEAGRWNYEHPELDELGKKGMNGRYLTAEDYWAGNLRAAELGLRESVRIFLVTQMDKFVANKARFNRRMVYGLGDGLNGWSIRSADVKPGADGLKTLRVIQYSARGTLFMSAWNPVGVDGFSDVYSMAIAEAVSDPATFESPNNARDVPLRTVYNPDSVEFDAKVSGEAITGGLAVPPDALKFDSGTKTWKPVGPGVTAWTKGTGKLLPGKWHNGIEIGLDDVMYAAAFAEEWANKDGEEDKYFDAPYAAQYKPALETGKGTVLNPDGSLTSYADYYFPGDAARTAAKTSAVGTKAGNPGRQTLVPWDVYEVLALLTAEDSASGTVYSFGTGEAVVTVDIAVPGVVGDIKAKYREIIEKSWVPRSIKDYTTPEKAGARYKASLAFIEKHGHAFISNGPFVLTTIDGTTNSVILEAFRDYPYRSGHWPEFFRQEITRIENVKTPASPRRDADGVFEIAATYHVYPEIEALPLGEKARVEIRLQMDGGAEKVYPAGYIRPGVFSAAIPAADMGVLETGRPYTVVVISSLADEAPSVVTVGLTLF
jgi:peptide/nickel transport system substrate-binding protein